MGNLIVEIKDSAGNKILGATATLRYGQTGQAMYATQDASWWAVFRDLPESPPDFYGIAEAAGYVSKTFQTPVYDVTRTLYVTLQTTAAPPNGNGTTPPNTNMVGLVALGLIALVVVLSVLGG